MRWGAVELGSAFARVMRLAGRAREAEGLRDHAWLRYHVARDASDPEYVSSLYDEFLTADRVWRRAEEDLQDERTEAVGVFGAAATACIIAVIAPTP